MAGNQVIDWNDLPTSRQLREQIDHLDISADAKVILLRVSETTMDIGGRLVAIGRRIVAFALNLVRQFPNLAFCIIVAFVISALLTSIPLLGTLLGIFVTPLITAAGVGGGALLEIKDGDLRRRIDLLITEFEQILG